MADTYLTKSVWVVEKGTARTENPLPSQPNLARVEALFETEFLSNPEVDVSLLGFTLRVSDNAFSPELKSPQVTTTGFKVDLETRGAGVDGFSINWTASGYAVIPGTKLS